MSYKGQKGTYNGSEVEVTLVHEDGKLDLQKVWSGTGSAENLPWYERVDPSQFTTNEPEKSDAADDATIEDLTGGPGDGNTDLPEEAPAPVDDETPVTGIEAMGRATQDEIPGFEQARIPVIESAIIDADEKRALLDVMKTELRTLEANVRKVLRENMDVLDHQEDGQGHKIIVYKRAGYEAELREHERLSYEKVSRTGDASLNTQ